MYCRFMQESQSPDSMGRVHSLWYDYRIPTCRWIHVQYFLWIEPYSLAIFDPCVTYMYRNAWIILLHKPLDLSCSLNSVSNHICVSGFPNAGCRNQCKWLIPTTQYTTARSAVLVRRSHCWTVIWNLALAATTSSMLPLSVEAERYVCGYLIVYSACSPVHLYWYVCMYIQ